MVGQNDRLVVFPSTANFTIMKNKLAAAERGLALVAKKRDALKMQQRTIKMQMFELNESLTTAMANAMYALNRAKYFGVDLLLITQQVSKTTGIKVVATKSNIVGVVIPNFKIILSKRSKIFPFAGLSKGGQQLQVIRDSFQDLIKDFLKLASLLYANNAIADAIVAAVTRTNALEYIIIPKIKNTVAYIGGELDEYAREEFYRLKKARDCKKRKDMAKKEKNRELAHVERSENFHKKDRIRNSLLRGIIRKSIYLQQNMLTKNFTLESSARDASSYSDISF